MSDAALSERRPAALENSTPAKATDKPPPAWKPPTPAKLGEAGAPMWNPVAPPRPWNPLPPAWKVPTPAKLGEAGVPMWNPVAPPKPAETAAGMETSAANKTRRGWRADMGNSGAVKLMEMITEPGRLWNSAVGKTGGNCRGAVAEIGRGGNAAGAKGRRAASAPAGVRLDAACA